MKWQKGISLEKITEHHWTWEHRELKKKTTQNIQAEKVSSGTVGICNLRFSSFEQPELILLPLFIRDQYNRIIS